MFTGPNLSVPYKELSIASTKRRRTRNGIFTWQPKNTSIKSLCGNSIDPDLPAAFDKVQCKILSSLDPGNELEGSLRKSIQYLMDAMSFYKEDSHWRPIEITLRNIPEQMVARLRLDMENDFKFKCDAHIVMFEWISNESKNMCDCFEMLSCFQSVLCQFNDLLGPLGQKIERK